jgi:mRNA interferase MazF
MVKLSVGDVVFVNFPFSNLTQSKLRPAVIIASVKNNDWILCQITSKAYSDSSSLKIESDSFEQGSLNITSYIRPGKIFTAHESIVNQKVSLRINP